MMAIDPFTGLELPATFPAGTNPCSGTPISLLPIAGAFQGGEQVPMVQDGETVRASLSSILVAGPQGPPGPQGPQGVIADAPTDGQYYSRRNDTWQVSPGGLTDAPNDGTTYARNSAAWVHLTHNDITDWSANVPAPSITTPVMDGIGAIGSFVNYARADHVHPSDTSRYAASNPSGFIPDAPNDGTSYARNSAAWTPLAAYLPLSGGTLTGTLNGVVANFTGTVTTTGVISGSGSFSGALSATQTFTLNTATTGGTSEIFTQAGVRRWSIIVNGTESGGNTGSDFHIDAHDDSGTLLTAPITITRATGEVQIHGSSTNDGAATGYYGEVISANVTSPVSLTTASAVNVASISLTPGDWDVTGEVWFAVGTGGATDARSGISATTGTIPNQSAIGTARNSLTGAFAASTSLIMPLRPSRVSLATTTTYFLIGQLVFPTGTCTATGNIWARRAR